MTTKHVHREPLTSDIIFKAVFGQDTPESKAVLIEMLNLILDRKEDPIIDVTYLNPFSIAEDQNEKTIVMDINVETSKGELIDIEMQIGKLDTYINRTIFYGCKQLTKGLERGDDYGKMKKSIVISFITTTLFPPNVPMHSIFTLRESIIGKELSNILELHYIELGKIDFRNKDFADMDPLEQFGAYLKCSGNSKEIDFVEALVRKGEKVISMADTVLRKISEEERLQALRESREKAELAILMEKTFSREQGCQEGKKIATLEIARNLKKDGIPVDIISRNTGLSEDEINNL